MSLKPFRIVVHNDLDGGASAVCIVNHIKYKYGDDAKYSLSFRTYQNVNPYVEQLINSHEQFERVFIADISVEDYIAKAFPDTFILLDHHDTAEALNGINKCIVDTSGNHCGASLCYKHLLKDQGLPFKHLKSLTAIALDYDLWHHKLPNRIAKNLNFLYYRYWGDDFVTRFAGGFDGFTSDEKTFLKEKWTQIENEIKNTELIDFFEDDPEAKGKMCVAIMPNNNGEVNEICEHALDERGFLLVFAVNPKKRKMSIRASNRLEKVEEFHVGNTNAELKIGGGHKLAGGATYSDDEHLQKICEAYAERLSKAPL